MTLMNVEYQTILRTAREMGYTCTSTDFYKLVEMTAEDYNRAQVLIEATLIQAWLRDNYDIHIVITPARVPTGTVRYGWTIYTDRGLHKEIEYNILPVSDYNQTLINALSEALPYIKEQVIA
jgi:hypothetical protein